MKVGALFAMGVAAAMLSGCVQAPSALDQAAVEAIASPTTSAIGGTLAGGTTDTATWAAMTAAARHSVIRVRNQTCDGLATGSGFVYGPQTLITNAHVVEGARHLSVDTADGGRLDVTVADTTSGEDIAVVHTAEELPAPLALDAADPVPGDLVQALGFPLGNQFTAVPGRVIGYADGAEYQHDGRVLQSSVTIRPGNSGGPLLDRAGRVAGVMFAVDLRDGTALAIPASRVRTVLSRSTRKPVTGDCPTS